MRSERIASLARVLQSKAATYMSTHSAQWMERSLDDSACVSILDFSVLYFSHIGSPSASDALKPKMSIDPDD
jgi:adenylosuccinate lyase